MSSERGKAVALSDGDNRFKSVQNRLNTLAKAMDAAAVELEGMRREMNACADRSESAAVDIANAGLDKKCVEVQNLASVALGGAAVEIRKLVQTADEVSGLTDETKRVHDRLYGLLDERRSSRRQKTPKPGFLTRRS
ncbi:conjugal transfer protein TraB (plasmid) [Streptomyces sp. NBC_01724]|uniref:conjugal transfer protein TraB n=1 Tax=Streptomyces sp. NBC_01724 TaxID=2975922 RepID=UPI002E35CC91|nr:conjugal transfer protein TraB [Streptomyces sp. NBC_01724]